jgi:UDP-galactopyranose mutase
VTYDYLIVGAGFYGATFARLQTDLGRRCLVIDRRDHIAGNAYTYRVDDIDVHKYGPHIFHTDNDEIWQFVNRFGRFNNFINRPKAYVNGRLYSLPFNMNTFKEIWGVVVPRQAETIIESQRLKLDREPANLEEQALCLVGRDIYELLIKNYTQKQWNRHPRDLPADIIKRLPLRFTYDDNYFNDRYQGLPVEGYTKLVETMLDGIEVKLNCNYIFNRAELDSLAKRVVYTGGIDEYFDYDFGTLAYRGLKFETEILDIDNLQGNAVINFPESSCAWTRVIEHKHFNRSRSERTVITREYPAEWFQDQTAYYPINDSTNQKLFRRYQELAETRKNVIFGGRLAEYRYYDMHQVIGSAMAAVRRTQQGTL